MNTERGARTRNRILSAFLALGLGVGGGLSAASSASALEPTYSMSSPTISFSTYGCQNANFQFGLTGIDPQSHWSVNWDDGQNIFEYDYGYGPTSRILTTSVCADKFQPGVHTIPAVLELSGNNDPAIGSGYTTKSIPFTMQFSTVGPTALPIVATLINDSGTVQVPLNGSCRTAAFSLTISGILASSSWSGTFRSGSVSTTNYGQGSGVFRVPVDICENSLPAGVNIMSAELEFSGIDDPSLGSGLAHKTGTAAANLIVSAPSKISIKATKNKLSGIFKPSNLGAASKVVVYFKAKGKSSFKKWKATTVASSGSWGVKKSLKPGAYYALAVGTGSVDGAKSRSVKVK